MSSADQIQKWYEIRDTLLGENRRKQDVKRALELCRMCSHPDAVWLVDVCAGKNVERVDELRNIFLELKDQRALCFASLLDIFDLDFALLRHSADLGFACAQAWVSRCASEGNERLEFATRSALQGERNGFFLLGTYADAEKNVQKAKENFLFAAQLGHVEAMVCFADCLTKCDPMWWFWRGKAATCGVEGKFPDLCLEVIERFKCSIGNRAIVFAIGQAFKHHPQNEYACEAINFFWAQCAAARKAVDTWTLVGIRFGIIKDIRMVLGRMIWDVRSLGEYNNNS